MIYLQATITAGTSRGEAARGLWEIASRLMVNVEASHNGCPMVARAGDYSPDLVLRRFEFDWEDHCAAQRPFNEGDNEGVVT